MSPNAHPDGLVEADCCGSVSSKIDMLGLGLGFVSDVVLVNELEGSFKARTCLRLWNDTTSVYIEWFGADIDVHIGPEEARSASCTNLANMHMLPLVSHCDRPGHNINMPTQ